MNHTTINYCPPIPNPEPHSIIEPVNSDFTIPKISLTQDAWIKIFHIIKAAGEFEVGFLGIVENSSKNEYLISDVFLMKQTVSAVECDFDQKDLGKFYNELLQSKNGKTIINKIMFWGHLHPHNSTEPSNQDDTQMDLFNHNDYFIRGIFTQTGETKFDFYDYAHKLKYLDCPWQIHVPDCDRYKEIKKEVQKKSKREKFTLGKFSNYGKPWRSNLTSPSYYDYLERLTDGISAQKYGVPLSKAERELIDFYKSQSSNENKKDEQ